MAKLNPNRVPVAARAPALRVKDFDEYILGYTEDEVRAEASRCLQCPNALELCRRGCPIANEIPGFMKAVAEGNWEEAALKVHLRNNLGAVCGRVCDQSRQCEGSCVVGKRGTPLAIGLVERYIMDWERAQGRRAHGVPQGMPSNKRVAVVGAGPAGLAAASDLARLGHQVTVFEALHVAGGVMAYGIPQFRLPRLVVEAEVGYMRSLGVEFCYDTVVGQTIAVDELLAGGYHVVFLGVGAGVPVFLGVPGETLSGIYSANEFLARITMMQAHRYPEYDTSIYMGKKVAVIGAGNTAIDAAQTALRLGVGEVSIVYRRSAEEMPARKEEAERAVEEGVNFHWLTNPLRFLGDDHHGRLAAMECIQMALGEPDQSGRRRPVPQPGSEFVMPLDNAILAVSTIPGFLVPRTTGGLQVTRWGTIVAHGETGATDRRGVWAGGDVVSGPDTVVRAIRAGKRAAQDIDAYLRS
ncbi:MAG: NADPH-dependent glutamate synthase [Chloroflexi bacterium]|nr:NADPH-dependent glutamate synthase [Chloroflexota bacterium]